MKRQSFNNQNIKSTQKSQYFSFLCRNGPLPEKYHHATDFYCVVIYLILLISFIFLICYNRLGSRGFSQKIYEQNYGDLLFGYRFHINEIILSGFSILTLSMIISLLALWIPSIMASISIVILFILSTILMIDQFLIFFKLNQKYLQPLISAFIILMIQIITIIMLYRRFSRLKMLGTFLSLSSKIIKPHLVLIYTHMIVLSFLELFFTWVFANLYYGISTIKQIQEKKAINFFAKTVLIIFWLWTSGLLIAVSDYFMCSFTVEWFYNLSKYDQQAENYQNQPRNDLYENQYQMRQSRPKRIHQNSISILKTIYSKMLKQSGTIIFGSILAYLPLYLIAKVQKLSHRFSSKLFFLSTYSKYGYLNTIMQWSNFQNANYRIYQLRHRIKPVMPQLYMLGHLYGNFTKLSLILIGIALIHKFIDMIIPIHQSNIHFFQYVFTLFIFGIGVGLQITTNFANIIGKTGDISFFLYCIDLEIQRVHYSNNINYSTPQSLMVILRNLTIKRQWKE